MNEYRAYLSIGARGVHAHILDLPGCFVSGANLEAVLKDIPGAIRVYLGQNGAEVLEEPRFRVVETLYDQGNPFDRGDASALFEAEKQPLNLAELDHLLSLAVQNRSRLMSLVGDLPQNILDWQASPDSFSIRRILRHIGNAEEWYVSRLVAPDSLPPEWEDDAEMPLFDFLEIERRTVFARLQKLSQAERSGIPKYPSQFTSNPDEAWTARKALRRLLEHEYEHTAHIRDVLAGWRRQYLARLAAERSWLLWQLRGLSAETLRDTCVFEDWSPQDLLAHLGEWDRIHTTRLLAIGREDWDNVVDTATDDFYDRENARLHQAHKQMPLESVVREAQWARREFVSAFQTLSDERLFCEYDLPGGEQIVLSSYVHWRHRHDAMHGSEIKGFRESQGSGIQVGAKVILQAILEACFDEMLALMEIVSEAEKVTGDWSMRDVLGHLADWEQLGVEAVRQYMQGRQPEERGEMGDAEIEAWNAAHAAARQGQSLEQAARDYRDARAGLLSALRDIPHTDLAGSFVPPWGGQVGCYAFFLEWAEHDREHAAVIRRTLGWDYPDRLLKL